MSHSVTGNGHHQSQFTVAVVPSSSRGNDGTEYNDIISYGSAAKKYSYRLCWRYNKLYKSDYNIEILHVRINKSH